MKRTNFALRYFIMIFFVGVVFALYIFNLVNLQLVHGEENAMKAEKTAEFPVTVMAARGEILDRNGKPIAVNAMGYSIIFDALYMTKDNMNDTIQSLLVLFDKTEETWVDEFPIVVKGENKYEFVPDKEKETEALRKHLRLNVYATAENCMEHLIERYELEELDPKTKREMAAVRYQMEAGEFSKAISYVFAENVTIDTVSRVKENIALFPGVDVRTYTIRQYPEGTLAPHLIGTIGKINAEEYAELKDEGYLLNDTLGKSGIEKAMEEYLRGKIGKRVIHTDHNGKLVNVDDRNMPTPGNTVMLTLDNDLQRITNQALIDNINEVAAKGKLSGKEKEGGDCSKGAIVVLNAKNFEVLAYSSYPSFDLSTYREKYEELAKDEERTPLLNRALNGTYAPGSTMKPAVALGALQENVLNAGSHLTCSGVMDYQTLTFRCLGNHGSIGLITALTKSCNIFFYQTGDMLGIEKMNLYSKRLGQGQLTGVEVSESKGILAGKEARRAQGKQWYPGDTLQAAIGQSDNVFTPIQFAVYAATIANGGTRYEAHFVKEVRDYAREKVIFDKTGSLEVVAELGVDPENIDLVKRGMRDVCLPGGTAANTFADFNIAVAGKTGTAQGDPSSSDNGNFICFAPYDDPEIAIAVILENGAHGGWAAPAARAVMEYYFNGRDITSNSQEGREGDLLGDAAVEDQ